MIRLTGMSVRLASGLSARNVNQVKKNIKILHSRYRFYQKRFRNKKIACYQSTKPKKGENFSHSDPRSLHVAKRATNYKGKRHIYYPPEWNLVIKWTRTLFFQLLLPFKNREPLYLPMVSAFIDALCFATVIVIVLLELIKNKSVV